MGNGGGSDLPSVGFYSDEIEPTPDNLVQLYMNLAAMCDLYANEKEWDESFSFDYCSKIIAALQKLDKDALRKLRNSFFADSGYIFNDDMLNKYFSEGIYQ